MYHPHIWELQTKSWKCSSHELVIVAVGNITARHIGKDSLVVGFFCFKLPGAKCQTAPWLFKKEKGTCRRPTEAKSPKMSRLIISDHLLMIFGWFSEVTLLSKERSRYTRYSSSSRREMVLEERLQSLKVEQLKSFQIMQIYLVGGFNPFEKYQSNWIIFAR